MEPNRWMVLFCQSGEVNAGYYSNALTPRGAVEILWMRYKNHLPDGINQAHVYDLSDGRRFRTVATPTWEEMIPDGL